MRVELLRSPKPAPALPKPAVLLVTAVLLALVRCEEGVRVGAQQSDPDVLGRLDSELPNPYDPATRWGELPAGRAWGATSAVHVDVDGTSMWVFERCGADACVGSELDPILKFDADGNLLTSFGAGMFVFPHGIHVDRDGNVWTADARSPTARELETYPEIRGHGSQVIKFSPSGEVLLTLGTPGVAGDPPHHLTEPTAIVTAPNGDIFVAEGHSGTSVNRISKFAADGTFIMSWGSSGNGPGEFRVPHDLAIDSRGRLLVADRANYRIQIFDQDGRYIESWKQFGMPSGIYIGPRDILYVSDSHSWGDEPRQDNGTWRKGIRIGSARTGTVHYYLPDLEWMTRANSGAEGIGADHHGNVFGAIVRRRGIERHAVPSGGIEIEG